ncbi:vascular endothelial growth factor receptor 2 isoform X1 [Alosa sapidissima]|uniref:vascular endothelial growth factor receptor 2 isoform X1 n=1 Tax=Alosa sapidissima TaxID=34773 RepID=UPI001C095606|nr:vascular endothelial growth factor receptor 2 isoform X1 [Alosa sapidissima]
MAKAFSVVYLVYTVLGISRVTALELRFTSEPPVLSLQESVHKINASDTLEITCRSKQLLEWVIPFNQSHVDGRLSFKDCSGAGLFCSTLVLTAATANETGLYRCSFKNQPKEDGKTSASVYVFVQDYRSPFVRSPRPYDVVFIREGEQVVIPCLGSVEDINVTLFMKYPLKELTPDGKIKYWDSKRGFVLPSHLISFAGLVYCQTHIHNETFSSSYYLIAVVGYKIHSLAVTPVQERLSVGERLVLNCTAHTELNVVLGYTWKFPQGQVHSMNSSLSRAKLQSHKKKLWNSLELSNTFTIENITMDDAGKYVCTASSGGMTKTSSVTVTVYEKPFIELREPLIDTLEVYAKDPSAKIPEDGSAKIPLKYTAYPAEPSVKWFKNDQLIRKEDNYRIRPGRDGLTILDVVEEDAGNYTAVLTNRMTKEERKHTFRLLVNVPPQIFEKQVGEHLNAHMYGSSPYLRCTSRGGLAPVEVQWQWMPKEDCPILFQRGVRPVNRLSECTQWRDVGNGTALNRVSSPSTITDAMLKTVSTLKIQRAEDHALYRCIATNKAGVDDYIIVFQVTRGLELSLNSSSEPIEQDNVALHCKADHLLYGNLTWYRVLNVSSSPGEAQAFPAAQPCRTLPQPLQLLPQAAPLRVQGSNITLELLLNNASQQDEGLYACQVESLSSPSEKTCLLHYLSLRALEPAKITSVLADQTVNVSDSAMMTCDVTGTPTPTIIWTKDNQTVGEGAGVFLKRSNSTLTILRVKKDDSGLYVCTACNSQGCDTDQATLTVEGAEEKMNVELIVPMGAVVIAIFFWILIVFVIRSRKRPSEELKTGYLSMILDDNDMPMDEHCERLTYDASKWEFPRDRLKLGEPLGRGAFGQVVEASAFGIEKATTCTTVAVKMLKEGATTSEYQALMSELKILIHIGHHLNVVNLLGACTKPGGPLMVIVEYCKHGNLSSYLKSKREEYSPFKRRGPSPWHRAQVEDDFSQGDLGLGTSTRLDICTGTASCFREDWTESCLEEQESDWDHLALEDLISYSFQVAKGMEFLSSRKCIHRDLAARNILLSENNVVKICDFGLARDVYKDPDYVRKGDARLPLKWMAPETIFDRVYTTQSDVWSFGVLLWEIFSLGASPYPGVAIDESFCRRLKEGTRMRAPDYATPEIYQTMLDCWLDRPTDRPTFNGLVEHLGNLLQASAHQDGKDYIPLMSGDQEGIIASSHPRGPLGRSARDSTAVQLHYDNAPTLGYPLQGDGQAIFEEIPLGHSLVRDVEIERAMGLSAEEMKRLGHHSTLHGTSRTHLFSPILRCKSKESLESESSNQTSGYQSGYHSDDAEVPIYANEEMILKRDAMKRPLPKPAEKFSVDVRYSAPPV